MNEISQVKYLGADTQGLGLNGTSLTMRDGMRVKKILVLNVNFWQLKKSYLKLKLKSENLGSA